MDRFSEVCFAVVIGEIVIGMLVTLALPFWALGGMAGLKVYGVGAAALLLCYSIGRPVVAWMDRKIGLTPQSPKNPCDDGLDKG